MIPYLEIKKESLNKLLNKLDSIKKESVIKRGLSQSTLFLARWSSENRIANLNPNRKQILADKLTARSAYGYKRRIFGQKPSDITKEGNAYIAKYGTNATNKGFSYPRLHEFGGRFHRKRPVLIPAIENKTNQESVLKIMLNQITASMEESK